MTRTYLVQLPRAEARYLAGVGVGWPATPEARCIHAIREWVNGVRGRQSEQVPKRKIIEDLEPLLAQIPLADRPLHGPFAARGGYPPLPGRVEYLGGGALRLDDAAISALAELRDGDDFHVTFSDAGPILSIGDDHYLAREEAPDAKS